MLTVIEVGNKITYSKGTRFFWRCICDCGNEKLVRADHLCQNRVKSCGCVQFEGVKKANITHGMSIGGKPEKTYRIWCDMRKRCENKKSIGFKHYGGRGIKVCERWQKFENFFEDMGECPNGMSIERIDVNGNYEPSNCKWATNAEQGLNKRNSLKLVVNGQRVNRDAFLEFMGMKRNQFEKYIAPIARQTEYYVWG